MLATDHKQGGSHASTDPPRARMARGAHRRRCTRAAGRRIGLAHDSISAMISGEIPSTSITWRRYSAHDISHLNAAY
ncbi:MAG TPA: hypothetical protein VFZ00_14835 [Solirubrobacter sp.]|nr:hypothetical protein [Solirubrobacter sp.]